MLQIKHTALIKPGKTLLAGIWVGADSNETIDVTNPANGKVIATVPRMGKVETERAILASAAAQKSWKNLTAAARAVILKRWFDLIKLHADDLAQILTAEQGKPLAEAKGEVNYGASFIEWFAEEAKRVYGETIPSPAGDRRLLVIKQPIGVTAAITPWNFPIAMITRKAA
jgi:succinate-semialdehyde dehydrogenase / glutarate-semialdehyde dehydrogenase